jgi:hypothetical protein
MGFNETRADQHGRTSEDRGQGVYPQGACHLPRDARTIEGMSEDNKCPKCGEPGAQLPAGKYGGFEFDNAQNRGYQCPNPGCAWIFVASQPADPKHGLKSLDDIERLKTPSRSRHNPISQSWRPAKQNSAAVRVFHGCRP